MGWAGKGGPKKESIKMEVKTMDKKEKELKVLNPSMFCGDGSCGCGCGGPMESEDELLQDKTQKIRSSSDEESQVVTANPTERKGIKK